MIPKIIHIIWIGDESKAPAACIRSWRDRHPGWEVRLWGNAELASTEWRLAAQMQVMPEINGVADMMRWEILYTHGGIAVDADSMCLRPLEDWMLEAEALACWESEQIRPGLISCAVLGCEPENGFIGQIIHNISETDVTQDMAWVTVGPGAITGAHRETGYANLTILPAHMFIPKHFSSPHDYAGSLVYARQFWGSTHGDYGSSRLDG